MSELKKIILALILSAFTLFTGYVVVECALMNMTNYRSQNIVFLHDIGIQKLQLQRFSVENINFQDLDFQKIVDIFK